MHAPPKGADRMKQQMLLAIIVGLAGSCARHETALLPPPRVATLRVVNDTRSRALIWVAARDSHLRLGEVRAHKTVLFRVPLGYLTADSVRFLAFRKGSSCVHDKSFASYREQGFVMALFPGMKAESPAQAGEVANKPKAPCRWD